jgi:hypothetical protein
MATPLSAELPKCFHFILKSQGNLNTVADDYNPSYSGGGDWEEGGLRPTQAKGY